MKMLRWRSPLAILAGMLAAVAAPAVARAQTPAPVAPATPAKTLQFPVTGGDYLDSTDAPAQAASAPPLRVLFISDGGRLWQKYDHNEAYRLFRLIAAAGLQRRVVVGQVTRPGGSLTGLYLDARPVIEQLPWDYVVLQEHPFSSQLEYVDQFETTVARGGQPTPEDSANLSRSHRTFQEVATAPARYEQVIKATSARMVYTVFGRDLPGKRGHEAILGDAARSVNPIIASFSTAWRAAFAADSSIDLRAAAGHSGPLGMYLQALVYYRVLTGRSPIGLPAPPVEEKVGTFVIPPREVELLQRAAAAVSPAAGTKSGP